MLFFCRISLSGKDLGKRLFDLLVAISLKKPRRTDMPSRRIKKLLRRIKKLPRCIKKLLRRIKVIYLKIVISSLYFLKFMITLNNRR